MKRVSLYLKSSKSSVPIYIGAINCDRYESDPDFCNTSYLQNASTVFFYNDYSSHYIAGSAFGELTNENEYGADLIISPKEVIL